MKLTRRINPRTFASETLLPLSLFIGILSELNGFNRDLLLPNGYVLFLSSQLLFILVAVMTFRTNQKARIPALVVRFGIGAILTFGVFSLFFANDLLPIAAKRLLHILLTTAALGITVTLTPHPKKVLRRLAILLTLVGLLLSTYSLFLLVLGWGNNGGAITILGVKMEQCTYSSGVSLRLCSLTNNPNSFGLFAMLGILSSIYLRLQRIITTSSVVVILVILSTGLFLSSSRTAIIAAIVGLTTIFLISLRLRMPSPAQIGAYLLTTTVSILTLQFLDFDTRLSSSDLSGRLGIWSELINSIKKSPFGGSGFGVSRESILNPTVGDISGHNLYLVLAAEIGLPALAIFILVCLVALFSAALRTKQEGQEFVLITALITAILAHQTMEVLIFRTDSLNTLFFCLIGLAVAAPGSNNLSFKRGDQHPNNEFVVSGNR